MPTLFIQHQDDVHQKQVLLQMKRQLADTYLKKMNVAYEEIEDFLAVIRVCRQYE
ncbi:MAG: hypothetical protein ACRDDX_09005 [Cellulosilyticaceae bacterium]